MTEKSKLAGTLEGFRDWAEGRSRGSGRHYPALEALERYQMYEAYMKKRRLEIATRQGDPAL